MNINTRQPARRPLGPTRIRFNPKLGRELRWKDSVDTTRKLSADFIGFANIIFLSFNQLDQDRPAIKENRTRPNYRGRPGRRLVEPRDEATKLPEYVPIQVVSDRQKTLQKILWCAISS
jgi:hypothetical protein